MTPEQISKGRQSIKPANVSSASATATAVKVVKAVKPAIPKVVRTDVPHPHPIALGKPNPLVDQWIMEACAYCGCPELAGKISWEISSDKLINSQYYGWATTNWAGHSKKRVASGHIIISTDYWFMKGIYDPYRKNLVVHETCHIISNYLHGYDTQHDENWRKAMRLCGEVPAEDVLYP